MSLSSFLPAQARKIPRGIWALGFVSLLMDVSSEMIHALLPIYLVTVLGASFADVGLIEGIAEATAAITKIFSGALSDWLGRRKLLAAAGYGLAALTKPIFPLASSLGWVVAARFIDRIGKGVRGAPRDALIADLSPPELRGASFGLRQSLDTVGAFIGPLIAIGLMAVTANAFRAVFWVAVLPGFLAVALLVAVVKEPERAPVQRKVGFPLSLPELRRLKPSYWLVTGVATLFTLARFSEAFLILRAKGAGLPIALAPLVLVVMNSRLCAGRLPSGAPVRPAQPNFRADARLRPADIGRSRPGAERRARRHRAGRCALGPAARVYPGLAGDLGRRHRAHRPARHGFWSFQSARWSGSARGERRCGRGLGSTRPASNLPRRRRRRHACPAGARRHSLARARGRRCL